MSDGARPDAVNDLDEEQAERRVWRCAACEQDVADPASVVSVAGRPALCRFPNPAGFVWEIVTLTDAWALADASDATTAYTWFAGYAWTIVVCASCSTHLGWRYDAVASGRPRVFWGLVRARLVGD